MEREACRETREQKASLRLEPLADSRGFAICFLTCCVLSHTCASSGTAAQSRAPSRSPLPTWGLPNSLLWSPQSRLQRDGWRQSRVHMRARTHTHIHTHLISRGCDTFTLTQNTAHRKSDWGTEPSSVNLPACALTQACPTLYNPVACSPPGSSVHRIFPDKNPGVGCQALLQGIFPTQGSNPLLFTSPAPAG